jgi:hypothetical protein
MNFITAIVFDGKDCRTFGYFESYQDALKTVELNYCDMYECLYKYIVIESIGPGIHPNVMEENWFVWENDKWQICEKPSKFLGIVNWALG